ncbi:MAG TPA: hypothetical protein VNL14_16490 [Candidatus Acidoferrales bacterium]|nr:hypothetical protein [Candidatus Acidoferrales bacterium]
MNCQKCGAAGARFATYAGILCESCDAALKKVCDFCSGPASWQYPVRTFRTPT